MLQLDAMPLTTSGKIDKNALPEVTAAKRRHGRKSSPKKELEKDRLDDGMSGELEALEKALDMDKEQFLRLKKSEIIPFIEEEIVVRYHFQRAGVELRIRYDEQLKTAMTSPLIKQY